MKTWLVTGATGLLGMELVTQLRERGERVTGLARSGSDVDVDLTDLSSFNAALHSIAPDVVVNCAALVDLAACEADAKAAHAINARPASLLSVWASETGKPFVQVSTDHYFDGDGPARHDEGAQMTILNAYAASKLAGEMLAATSPHALILRTNFCGARKGFGRWALDALKGGGPVGLFTDYYTSTMEVGQCAAALIDLVEAGARGTLNLAARESASKYQFVTALAEALGWPLNAVKSSAASIEPRRAMSCGLDVSRAEALLGRSLPTLDETVAALAAGETRCATQHASILPVARSA